MVINNST